MASLFNEEQTSAWVKTLHKRASHAVVILEADEQALFVKANYKTHWTFPGGWIDEHESPAAAAVRELKEETNISIDQTDLEFVCVVVRKSQVADTYEFIYRAKLRQGMLEGIILQASEIDDWRLVSKEDVLSDNLYYSKAASMWAKNDTRKYAEQSIGHFGSSNDK